MLTSTLVAGGIIASTLNGVGTLIGASIWLVCVWGLQRMAKADPQLSRVYLRQLSYREYYGAHSHPARVSRTTHVY
jgi:type IV secretion system protein VirB3